MKAKAGNRGKIPRGRPYMNDFNDQDSSEPANKTGPGNHSYVRAPVRISSVKSRKELRKQQRKAKKSQKHQYLLFKCGREDLVLKAAEGIAGKQKKKKKKNKNKNKKERNGEDDNQDETSGNKRASPKENTHSKNTALNESESDDEDEDEKFVRESVRNKLEKRENVDLAEELKQDNKDLEKTMNEMRRKRLLEENEREEKTIKQLAKMLKLKSKSKIPASFRTDGLDFVLEACEQASKKKKSKEDASDQSDDEGNDDDDDIMKDSDVGSDFEGEDDMEEDDFDAVEGDSDLEEADEEDMEDGEEESEDNLDDEIFGSSNSESEPEDVEAAMDLGDESEEEEATKPVKSKGGKEKQKDKPKSKKKDDEDDGVWEDIYGRLRSKDGSVLDSKTSEKSKPNPPETSSNLGKYIPPALRGNQSNREKLAKQLKGLLNRLSESNMHSIANQVEEMYMSNSRNEMNQTLLELLSAALIRPTLMPERVILEHTMLVAILHANVGTEVGAFFIQSFTQEFKSKYDQWDSNSDEEDKRLENLLLVISSIYHFKIVDACLVYDILRFLSDSFKPKDVELILTALRSIGFRLRKDDPVALKELILLLQQKASKQQADASGSAKVKFMMEILMAIRNNNMNKIPNYDPSYGEHLQKILKTHLHPGNYVSEMKIGLKDLLNADKSGRWWIVGSAWAGKEKDESSATSDPVLMSSEDAVKHAKLMKRARAQGMNTDARRNIFCILMTAEDYMDAFEKLNHLGLRNNQDREIIHVTTYCCLQEKKFNPYYAYIVSKFCTTDRKLMLALQYNLWDRLKDLESLPSHQRNNLANLLTHLINDRSLPISTLKVIEYTEMDKIKLKFLKKILTGILLQKEVDNLQEIFMKPATSEKLGLFKESLRLFLNHFMLQTEITTADGSTIKSDLSPKEMELLKERVKIAEKCMSLGRSSLLS